MTFQIRSTDSGNLLLCDRYGESLDLIRCQACILVLLEECNVGITIQGFENEVRLCLLDLADDRRVIGMTHRGILLTDNLHSKCLSLLLHDLICRARENVIGTEQEYFLSVILTHVLDCRNNLLVRSSSYIKDVRG